jgi:RecG-like helicase
LSQTENPETNSDERIRKIYVKDLKLGEGIHTVFRAARKEKHTSRGGKSFLALTLVDRTGEIDGRVFDNVDAADQAFSADDYLLVKGKIGQFHGKSQVVIDRLERLDAGPIDAAEFAFTPAPVPEKTEKPERAEKPVHASTKDAAAEEGHAPKVHLSRRLAKLLENPQVAQALDVLVAQLEKTIEERIHAKAGLPPPARTERPPRERKPRGPRVEHKPRHEAEASGKPEHKPEPKRDPSLPEGLAFKPFNALVNEGEKPAETKSETPTS